MFGFLTRKPKKAIKRSRKSHKKSRPKPALVESDATYDIVKKISDLQDQLGRHDSRISGMIDEHHNFMQSQHHEPMKKAVIEIMNKLYSQPDPVRKEVFRIIKSDEKILSIIGEDKKSAGDVAERMNLTREHISRRISILTKNGLLTRIQEGKRVFYVKPENM